MKKTHGLAEIIAIIEPEVKAAGYDLVDVVWGSSFKRRTLTLFVDKTDGIMLDDCQSLSRRVGSRLDECDLISGSYVLEVSSPGAERPLKTTADFERFMGRYALITTREHLPQVGTTQLYGYLRGLEEDSVLLELAAEQVIHVPLTQIVKARLAIKF